MRKGKQSEVRPYTSDNPDPLDVEVGSRLRFRRKVLGISQQVLADSVGVTFQQIQKYERGVNRLSASRIWDFSAVLGVPVSFFFEGLDGIDIKRSIPRARDDAKKLSCLGPRDEDPASRTETLELCHAFWAVTPPVRRTFLDLVKTCTYREDPSAIRLDTAL